VGSLVVESSQSGVDKRTDAFRFETLTDVFIVSSTSFSNVHSRSQSESVQHNIERCSVSVNVTVHAAKAQPAFPCPVI
jgi:hypothetical protein